MCPPAGRLSGRDDVVGEGLLQRLTTWLVRPRIPCRRAVRLLVDQRRAHGWLRQVTRKQVEKSWHVGRALNRSVAAQGENAATRSADVTEEELKNRRGANRLDAVAVLGPTDGVADGA